MLLLICSCSLAFRACNYFELIKDEYADWESLMKVPEIQRSWYTPLFDGNESYQDKIFNIFTYYYIDGPIVWGKFSFKDNFLDELPIQMHTFTDFNNKNNKGYSYIKNIGFDENKIEYYFYEIGERHRTKYTWYYFIVVNENIIYFYNNY
jgi:hypothetical protein